jgi:hypothetical protein
VADAADVAAVVELAALMVNTDPPAELGAAEAARLIHAASVRAGADIRGDDSRRSVTRWRYAAMYLARHRTCLSLPKLGRMFCRDHTTVLHGINQVRAGIAAADPRLTAAVFVLQQDAPIRPEVPAPCPAT